MRSLKDVRNFMAIQEFLQLSGTTFRDYVGVVSFSSDPLIPTMWAHYAENAGFVVGLQLNKNEGTRS